MNLFFLGLIPFSWVNVCFLEILMNTILSHSEGSLESKKHTRNEFLGYNPSFLQNGVQHKALQCSTIELAQPCIIVRNACASAANVRSQIKIIVLFYKSIVLS